MTDIRLSPSRKTRKKSAYHHGDLRNAIIEAVAGLIAERRSLDFQLKEVGKLVGTSSPAMYRHFASKQDLLVETAIAGYVLQENYRTYAIEQAGASPLARLLAVGHAYIHFARTHPGYFLLMKSMETEEILSSERYQAQRQETLRIMRSLVCECIEAGLFVELDIDLAMASLQATAFGLAHLYTADELRYLAPSLLDDDDLVSRIFSVNLGNLLSPKGRRQIAEASRDPFSSQDKSKERTV